jgi:hypothetical protein
VPGKTRSNVAQPVPTPVKMTAAVNISSTWTVRITNTGFPRFH